MSARNWRMIVIGLDLAFWALLALAIWSYPVVQKVVFAAFGVIFLDGCVAGAILFLGRRK